MKKKSGKIQKTRPFLVQENYYYRQMKKSQKEEVGQQIRKQSQLFR